MKVHNKYLRNTELHCAKTKFSRGHEGRSRTELRNAPSPRWRLRCRGQTRASDVFASLRVSKRAKKKKKKKHLQSRKAAAAAAKARRSEARAGVAASEQQLNRTAEEPRLQVEKLKPNRSAAAGGTSQDESPANEHQPPAALVSAAACRAFRCSSVNPAAKYSGLESGSYLRLRRVSSTPSAVGF